MRDGRGVLKRKGRFRRRAERRICYVAADCYKIRRLSPGRVTLKRLPEELYHMRVTCTAAGCSIALLLAAGLSAPLQAGAAADSTHRLVDAAKSADLDTLRTMVQQQHVDVNEPQVDGTTALHWAVHRDDLNAVNLLLGAGANARATNRYGATPLSLACINGNAAIVERLLVADADPDVRSGDGETPLMTASRTGAAAVVTLLAEYGADVNATETWRGQTALMWAVAEQHASAVRALLDAGADAHGKSTKGFTPFLFAV